MSWRSRAGALGRRLAGSGAASTSVGGAVPVAAGDPFARYEAERTTEHRDAACNAPRTNLYFSATGEVGPCWIQMGGVERWGPDRSIRDLWEGPALSGLRQELAAGRYPGRCERCRADIERGGRPLAAVYDHPGTVLRALPTALELELSNLCNLACTMCNGDLSSKIRHEREGLPPLEIPYDRTFVEQVAELVPTLEHVRFSGGEPLLHRILYEICDLIVESRPDLRITISTNGSTLTPKVRRLLERANVQINISFESLRAERYEAIRVGADHARLLANIEAFRELTAPNGGFVTINTNPMRATWDEMADIVRYCDERELHLTFNTVLHPAESSLASLPAAELEAVLSGLAAERFAPDDRAVVRWNHAQFDGLVAQVRGWLAEARGRPVPVLVRARAGAAR